jgi:UDP-N-acetylmuramyl-tripeptide synthetase
MENYFHVKEKIFIEKNRDIFKCDNAIINIDDIYGKILISETDLNPITFSVNSSRADLYADNVICDTSGIKLDLLYNGKKLTKISSHLSGFFNIYNILAAAGAAISLGLSSEDIKKGAESDNEICGRFEKIKDVSDFTVIVDYAHTPDGLENVLKTAKSLLENGSKLISVFGCGGDRDKTKRPKMGKIAGLYSDFVFVTSDNPRTENPDSIISMIEEGIRESANMNYVKIIDRKKAILEALEMAEKKDIVVIAGKGHEDYQEFADYRVHFSDQEIIKEWNKERNRKKRNG